MEQQIRLAARKHLPSAIRRPLGTLMGQVQYRVIQYILGWLFDLKGGRFRASGCVFAVPRTPQPEDFARCF